MSWFRYTTIEEDEEERRSKEETEKWVKENKVLFYTTYALFSVAVLLFMLTRPA